jgi:hypothetical protein
LSVEDSNASGSETENTVLRLVFDKIQQMRREFEDILFLKHAADILKDFRKRLQREKWD